MKLIMFILLAINIYSLTFDVESYECSAKSGLM